jgi:gamma-glutamyltranspeptidase/glutathione hydrolase
MLLTRLSCGLLAVSLLAPSFASAAQPETGGRPTTMAPTAMVVTPNYLASQSAIKVLQNGGNALEAMIAAAATISVVYPHYNAIGGDNFWLIYNAKTGKMSALNGSGRSGERATIDFYKQKGFDTIPSRGWLAANTVPGVISGWGEAYRFATKEMGGKAKWNDLLKDAIGYAEGGFPVSIGQAKWTRIASDESDKTLKNLQRFPSFATTFLKPDGSVYEVGETFKQPDLAKTLKRIAEKGDREFYEGETARMIAEDVQANGGLLTLNDLRSHKADWVNPISVEYRGLTAYNLPPNTQGMASLSILNILNQRDVKSLGEGSADYVHLLVEATKQAFSDRDKYLTDPEFNKIPLDSILSKEHAKALSARIDMEKAAQTVSPLDPKGDTVWLGVVDKDGNAVSMIQSHYFDWGAGVVAKGTGVLLQNRGAFFSLDPTHVNRLEPRKRTFHTINPAMLLKDGKPYLVYGTQGGEGQPQTQAAVVTRIVDFGLPVQSAIEAPRWLHGRAWGAATNGLQVEGRWPAEVVEELKSRGHQVKAIDNYTDTMGTAGAILVDPVSKAKFGGADPRGDGAAVGY